MANANTNGSPSMENANANRRPLMPKYHVKVTSILSITFEQCCMVSVEVLSGETPHRPTYDVSYDVRLPTNKVRHYPNRQWIRHLRTTILEMLMREPPLDDTNCDAAVESLLWIVNLPIVHKLVVGMNKIGIHIDKPTLNIATCFSKCKIFQMRVKMETNDSPVLEIIMNDTWGTLDLAVTEGVNDMELHGEMTILIWTCPSYTTASYSFLNDAFDIFSIQKTSIAMVANPPPFVIDDAPSVCQNFPYTDHHVVSNWRHGFFVLWRREEISIHFFQEDTATANALILQYPRSLYSDI